MGDDNVIVQSSVEALISALQAIGKGSLADQAASDLKEAVKATMLERKKSSITIKLEIDYQSDEMVTLSGSSTAKIPKPKPSGSFFVNPMKDYEIGRSRPEQTIMKELQQ